MKVSTVMQGIFSLQPSAVSSQPLAVSGQLLATNH